MNNQKQNLNSIAMHLIIAYQVEDQTIQQNLLGITYESLLDTLNQALQNQRPKAAFKTTLKAFIKTLNKLTNTKEFNDLSTHLRLTIIDIAQVFRTHLQERFKNLDPSAIAEYDYL